MALTIGLAVVAAAAVALSGSDVRNDGDLIVARIEAYRATHGAYPRILSDAGVPCHGREEGRASATDDGWVYMRFERPDRFILWKRVFMRNSHYYRPGVGWSFSTAD